MAEKEMVGVRLPKDVLEEVEKYAQEQGITKSDAIRRMIKKGLDLDSAGLAVAASDTSRARNAFTLPQVIQTGLLILVITLLLI